MHPSSQARAKRGHEQWIADAAMLLLLMLARRGEASVDATVAEKTLGIVGIDHGAKAIARRASQGFGMNVLIYDALGRGEAIARDIGATMSPSLDHLLAEADFVSLHGHPTCDGAGIVNAQRLNQMKPGACLINTSSGELVDEQALLHALWFEAIGGAGICVPEATSARLEDLRTCENAIVLPHADNTTSDNIALPAAGAPQFSMAPNVVQLFGGNPRSD